MSESSREDRIWQIRAAALQGILANPGMDEFANPDTAESARRMADEMLRVCDAADLAAKKANR